MSDKVLNISIVKTQEYSKLPVYSREGDACMDCFADQEVTIPAFSTSKGLGRIMVPLGFKLALPHGYEAQIRPRSGLALRSGISVLNSPGTIDENYRGEVCAIMINTTTSPFKVEKGDRICQMAIRPISDVVVWDEKSELDSTNRNANGFGSSGV